MKPVGMKTVGMKTQAIKVKLRDGEMGAYVAIPDRTPAGAIIAIMEIWGVNDTMRRHAHEFAQAGFVCLVPDLFWRQELDAKTGRKYRAFSLIAALG
jgi:carboxymethylenebutenolidase